MQQEPSHIPDMKLLHISVSHIMLFHQKKEVGRCSHEQSNTQYNKTGGRLSPQGNTLSII